MNLQARPLPMALLTDFYQLTMAQSYFHNDMHEWDATFHLFFRRAPFGGDYAIACGLADVVSYLENFRFIPEAIQYLEEQQQADGAPLFNASFLEYLASMTFTCDVDAVLEGDWVCAHEPLLRIQGPLIQCQLLETALLNMLNFSTLIATKASRVCRAAAPDPVLEFGLRRAQGQDGALSASRAAYVGGVAATSNVLAGHLFGIPVKGTHAHSWIMAFPSEQEAFEAYAAAMPNHCLFLVDTYDTVQGVKHAIEQGCRLRELGHDLLGIRLDSGDLVELSKQARVLLDEHGFADAQIVASNDLDEYQIGELKARGAKIDTWGVGTNLVTATDQPALGGVFKLAALHPPGGTWQYKIKLSEQPAKTSNPGRQHVRRYLRDNLWLGDVIYDQDQGIAENPYPRATQSRELLQPIYRRGQLVLPNQALDQARKRTQISLTRISQVEVTVDKVRLSSQLDALKTQLIQAMSKQQRPAPPASTPKRQHRFESSLRSMLVAVDSVVFGFDGSDLKVLLMSRKKQPFSGRWVLPGGLLHRGESLQAGAERVLAAKTGYRGCFLEQLFTFGQTDRDPRSRAISVGYFALIRLPHVDRIESDQLSCWFPIHDLPELGFDHRDIIQTALGRLRGKIRYQPIGFELLPEKFKLSQLQELYEAILEHPLDKRNFRRKLLAMGLLDRLDEREAQVPHRAAWLYRFNQENYQKLVNRGFHFEL